MRDVSRSLLYHLRTVTHRGSWLHILGYLKSQVRQQDERTTSVEFKISVYLFLGCEACQLHEQNCLLWQLTHTNERPARAIDSWIKLE